MKTINDRPERFATFKKRLQAKGWTLLSTESEFINHKNKVTVKCPNDHIVEIAPGHLHTRAKDKKTAKKKPRGSGCPVCSGRNKTIQTLKDFAISKGWRCLSTTYKRQRDPFIWECPNGHKQERTYHYFLKCQSCDKCKASQFNLNDFKNLAKKYDGEVITGGDNLLYSGESLIQFKCKKGHLFRTRYHNALLNWCPHCQKK